MSFLIGRAAFKASLLVFDGVSSPKNEKKTFIGAITQSTLLNTDNPAFKNIK